MVNAEKIALFGLVSALTSACTPKFTDRFSAVNEPRVLAVKSVPAEAAPKSAVSYELLLVDENGPITRVAADWSYCTESKPTNELNDVAAACFGTNEQVMPFGNGFSPATKLPFNSCSQFGPDLPQTMPGQPQGRPADADSTGGYYQPVIVQIDADGQQIPTLGETRLTCGLAGASGDQAQEYRNLTHPNENPNLLSVTLPDMSDRQLSSDEANPNAARAGEKLSFSVHWPACPDEASCGDGICSPGETATDCPDDCTTPVGCGGSEPYAYLDPESHELVSRHEAMRVSWFATAGTFDNDHTGQSEANHTLTSSENGWTAPKEAGPAFIWVVLRDDRGGVDWKSFRFDIQ